MARGLKRVEQFANLIIEVGDIGEIGAAGAADLLFADLVVFVVVGIEDAFGMGVLIRVGDRADLRHQVIAVFVEIPVLLAGHIGVVRVGEADSQAPRAIIMATGEVIELARCVIGDLIIILHLVGDLRHPSTGDRAHVVIPPVDAFAGFPVVRRPTEVGWIDVRREAFLKPVELVRPDEMHLAREAGLIACTPQVVGVGRDGGGKLRRVVINTCAAGKLARHERRAAWGAEWGGCVAILETGRFRRQFLKVRRMKPVGGTVGKQGSVQLIHHDDEDVGLAHVTPPVSLTSSASAVASASSSGAVRPTRMYSPSISAASRSAASFGAVVRPRKAWVRLERRRF